MAATIELDEEQNIIMILNKEDFNNATMQSRTVDGKEQQYVEFRLYKLKGDKGRISAFGFSAIAIAKYFK
jgi:hypothetical protein